MRKKAGEREREERANCLFHANEETHSVASIKSSLKNLGKQTLSGERFTEILFCLFGQLQIFFRPNFFVQITRMLIRFNQESG